MVISRVNIFQNFPQKCQAVRRKIASELITLWEILSSTGLGCLTARAFVTKKGQTLEIPAGATTWMRPFSAKINDPFKLWHA